MPADPTPLSQRIATVRSFNRFYTRHIGALREGLLDTSFSLTESRLLWELAHQSEQDLLTATDLARELDLDPGYLSRLLRGLKDRGLIAASRAEHDGRHLQLNLTETGRAAFAPLNTRSQADVGRLLTTLTETQQQDLLQAMARIEHLLGAAPGHKAPWLLRPHRPGDIGWVVSRHGALYAAEYRWETSFEALVARIAADFIERFDAAREACWIAERHGANVGSVFLVQARDDTSHAPLDGIAQLRMLLVEPSARGLGIGERLVAECESFARRAGYRKIVLWTNSLLLAARGIYQKAGYRLTGSEPHHSFGHDLVGETWELDLHNARG